MKSKITPYVAWIAAVILILVFCRLGIWQLDRKQQKEMMLNAAAEQLNNKSPHLLEFANNPQLTHNYHWAAGKGAFLPVPAILLDNQMHQGRAGVQVFRAFQPELSSFIILVDLGWLPLPSDRKMPDIELPEGEWAVSGLLMPPRAAGLLSVPPSELPNKQLLALNLNPPEFSSLLHLNHPIAPRVLRLDPAIKLGFYRDFDILPNTLPPEKHLGYAVQWFGLALTVAIVALLLTFRRKKHPNVPVIKPFDVE